MIWDPNKLYFDGSGGTWSNQDDMFTTASEGAGGVHVELKNGTWNTNNFDVLDSDSPISLPHAYE